MRPSWVSRRAPDLQKTAIFRRFSTIFAILRSRRHHRHNEATSGLLGAILGHLRAILGPSWAILGPSWGPSWVILEPSWGILGLSWGHLGPSSAILGPSSAILGPTWRYLGPSWTIMGHLGTFWGHLGPSWIHLGHVLGHLGTIWGNYQGHLGRRWGHLGAYRPFENDNLLGAFIKIEKMMTRFVCYDVFSSRGSLDPILAVFGHLGIMSSSFDALHFKRASRSHAKTGLC